MPQFSGPYHPISSRLTGYQLVWLWPRSNGRSSKFRFLRQDISRDRCRPHHNTKWILPKRGQSHQYHTRNISSILQPRLFCRSNSNHLYRRPSRTEEDDILRIGNNGYRCSITVFGFLSRTLDCWSCDNGFWERYEYEHCSYLAKRDFKITQTWYDGHDRGSHDHRRYMPILLARLRLLLPRTKHHILAIPNRIPNQTSLEGPARLFCHFLNSVCVRGSRLSSTTKVAPSSCNYPH